MAIKDSIDHNKPYSCETGLSFRMGTLRHIKAVGDATRDCRGNPLTFTATIQDITEHKRIEDALRESEFHLARAQQIAHVGIWTWDVVNDQMYWSDEIYRLIGLAPGEFSPGINDFIAFVIQKMHGVMLPCWRPRPWFYDIDFSLVEKWRRTLYFTVKVPYLCPAGDPVTMGHRQDINERSGPRQPSRNRNQPELDYLCTTCIFEFDIEALFHQVNDAMCTSPLYPRRTAGQGTDGDSRRREPETNGREGVP